MGPFITSWDGTKYVHNQETIMKKLLNRKPPESAMHKLTQKMVNRLTLIWLTLVGYIVYVEFYKDIISIL